MSDIIKSTGSLGLSQWFTPVDDPEVTASVLSNTTNTVYEASPFRICNTGKSPYFSWSAPVKDKQKDASNAIPEINDPIVGLRGYILHYGTRLSLFDADNKKQLCNTVSSVIGFTSDQQPIINNNAYPITTPVYNGRGFSNIGDPAIPNTVIESLKVKGSRGLTCADCILKGEDEVTVTPESGPNQGKQQTYKCGASNKIIFCVLQFAIVELNDQNKSEVVWYTPDKYLSRKGTPVISKPFILEMNLGRAQATKKIGAKFAIVTEPHSCVPSDAVTWVTYLNNLNNPNNRRISIVKAADPSAFNCDYMLLSKTATEIWCGNATKEYENQMVHGWPVFRDWELETAKEFASVMETAFVVYDSERTNVDSLSFYSAEETDKASNPTLEGDNVTIDDNLKQEAQIAPQTRTKITSAVDIFRK